MISTPLDKYEADVYELAEHLAKEAGLEYSKKKKSYKIEIICSENNPEKAISLLFQRESAMKFKQRLSKTKNNPPE